MTVFSLPATSIEGTPSTFTASFNIDGEGVVRGTWAYDGTQSHLSGALSAVGGLTGPWLLWLAGGDFVSQFGTLMYLDGQFTMSVDATFLVQGNPVEFRASGTIGSDGIDTVVFADVRANYSVARDPGSNAWTVTHNSGTGGIDTLVDVERLQFADSKLAIDIWGNGGQAYRLYQAAFDRVPDVAGLGYQMHDLDTGSSLSQVAANFIASPEFESKYGTNLSDAEFVHLLYVHVLHREPGDFEVTYHVDHELQGGYSRADVLTFFSESPENIVGLMGTIGNGMVYVFP
jgi:hypothetical protein